METPRWWGVCNERGFLIGSDGNLIAFRLQSMAEAQALGCGNGCFAKEFPQNEEDRPKLYGVWLIWPERPAYPGEWLRLTTGEVPSSTIRAQMEAYTLTPLYIGAPTIQAVREIGPDGRPVE